MATDPRTDDQIRGAIQAAATLARQIENDPMSPPYIRNLVELLHTDGINAGLDELDRREQQK
ncbi:hypothetical protein ACWGN5_40170 [Streptomyces sp. NPDC055815]